ncbi:MAG: MATE family efflux transporter [Spirochaetes bacterium]|nr:MATE family efflux transporter [Spirochaetota bacterium]MBU0957085.1 MATE family efflux transporter [Spirochaetota bacterium]
MTTQLLHKKFGPASFYRAALAVALPVMAQQLIQSLVSLIDNFMVAGLGDAKMASVNVANQVNFIFFVLMFTLSGAGGVYMSQYNGAKDKEGMQQAFRFKAITTLFISTLFLLLCQIFPEHLIGIMTIGNSARDELIAVGAVYMRTVSWFFIPMALSQSIGSAFREIGRPKAPLVISVCATLLNTFLNWVLIYGNLGAPRLEVLGAAWATNIARAAELIAFMVYVRYKKPAFYVSLFRLLDARWKLFGEILRKSGLMVLSEATWVVSETVLAALYNGRGGAEIVAGMGAGWAIANIFFLIFTGIHVSTGVIVGGALGGDRLDEARDKARWMQSGSIVAGAFLGLLQMASLLLIPIVFANLTAEALLVTRGLLVVISIYLPLWSLLNAQFAVSRSGGDMMMGVVVDVGVTYVVFIPGAFALALLTPIGPVLLFAILKLSDFLKFAVARFWLKKELWVVNLAKPVDRQSERPTNQRSDQTTAH